MDAVGKALAGMLICAAVLLAAPREADATERCELALVLAVDVSGSVNVDEYAIQMKGLADAFRSSDIVHLIGQTNRRGSVHVTVVQWSGEPHQAQIVGWRQLAGETSVLAFANEISAAGRAYINFSTAIAEALAFSYELFDGELRLCRRRVIDVSGDGPNNEGRDIFPIHSALMRAEVTINGLAIQGEEPGLGDYYRDNVIGGNGAFVLTAETFEDFPDAIRRKLLREIAPPITFLPSGGKRYSSNEACDVKPGTC
jgi:Ca-activated chloride channel family protein